MAVAIGVPPGEDLNYLGIQEDSLRAYWWNDNEWILGGTTLAGDEGLGTFASVNVDANAYGMGYFGLNTSDNYLWIHATHASVYGMAGMPELAGDFDRNGICDGADFVAWQRGESADPLSQSDLADWSKDFGTTLNPMMGSVPTGVPEPASHTLFILVSLFCIACAWMKRGWQNDLRATRHLRHRMSMFCN